MKPFCLATLLFFTCSLVQAQCPQSGLKIESAACQPPENLRIADIACTVMKVTWRGANEQQYIAHAYYTDQSSKNVNEIKAAEITSDNYGNWNASFEVIDGSNITWNVQAICNAAGAELVSTKIDGPPAYIPACSKNPEIGAEKIRMYPNPSFGLITVQAESAGGTIAFNVFDVNGKKVFDKITGSNGKASGTYQLNLQGLLSGSYLLKVTTGTMVKSFKFQLLKK